MAPPSPPAVRRDRFGWPLPEGMEREGTDEPSAAHDDQSPPGQRYDAPPDDASVPLQSYNPYDTSAWRVPTAADTPPRGPYSGQMPVQQPGPDAPPRGGYSGPLPAQESAPGQSPRGPYSGQFPTTQPPPRQNDAYAAPLDPSAYDPNRSGPIAQSPYISGAMPQVQRSGPIAYPGEVTSTGSRRVIVAPDAGFGALLSDRPALAFLLAAAALAGAMIAFIALRYSHFPDQIALHFGPAGASEPTRIGEKRELWTIPFIVGIVLAADTALAWAVYRFDRFAARLLTLGSGLVAAIAWVVLLTVLHR